jgi:peptide/nickel transport system permease protein
MAQFALRRLSYGILVLVLVTCTVTGIIFLAPVDPAQLTFGQQADSGSVKAKTSELGLDQPAHIQMLRYINDISPLAVHPNTPAAEKKYRYLKLLAWNKADALVLKWPFFRESFQTGRPVREILGEAIPATALLAGISILLATILGISFGLISALKPHSWMDQFISVVSVIGYSLPSYVTAMLLALLLGFAWGDYTGLNIQGSLYMLDDFGEWTLQWKNLILPVLALGMRPVALITQLTRSAMLDVLAQDYMRTATAKGLPTAKTIIKHGLRNALNPIVSAVSGWFAALLTGAFFVETVFNFKGLGNVTVNALINYDTPVILGCVLFTSAVFILVNLISDLMYVWLDRRVAVGG